MAFAQHTRNSSSVSQNMSQDDSCHNDRVDVSLHLTPQDRSLVTGYWWWWMVPGLVTSSIWWLPVLAPGPGTVKTSATNNQSSARPAHAHNTLPPLLRALGGDLQWRHGAGVGFGQGPAVSRVLIWPGGRRGLPSDFIYSGLHHWLYSFRPKYAWNKLRGKCATHLFCILTTIYIHEKIVLMQFHCSDTSNKWVNPLVAYDMAKVQVHQQVFLPNVIKFQSKKHCVVDTSKLCQIKTALTNYLVGIYL